MNLLQVDHISTIRGRLHVIISSISPPRMMMVLCPAALTMLACWGLSIPSLRKIHLVESREKMWPSSREMEEATCYHPLDTVPLLDLISAAREEECTGTRIEVPRLRSLLSLTTDWRRGHSVSQASPLNWPLSDCHRSPCTMKTRVSPHRAGAATPTIAPQRNTETESEIAYLLWVLKKRGLSRTSKRLIRESPLSAAWRQVRTTSDSNPVSIWS